MTPASTARTYVHLDASDLPDPEIFDTFFDPRRATAGQPELPRKPETPNPPRSLVERKSSAKLRALLALGSLSIPRSLVRFQPSPSRERPADQPHLRFDVPVLAIPWSAFLVADATGNHDRSAASSSLPGFRRRMMIQAFMTRHAGVARSGTSSCTPTPLRSTSTPERDAQLVRPWLLEQRRSRTRSKR